VNRISNSLKQKAFWQTDMHRAVVPSFSLRYDCTYLTLIKLIFKKTAKVLLNYGYPVGKSMTFINNPKKWDLVKKTVRVK